MAYAHGLQAYKQTRVNTASQGELLLLLYDAAIRHVARACERLDADDQTAANTHLLKAQDIVAEMMASLDLNVELATSLFQLYEYCHHELVQANLSRRKEGLRPVLEILTELRKAWQQVVKGEHSHRSGAFTQGTEARGRGGIEIAT